jgi:hypothetical protein
MANEFLQKFLPVRPPTKGDRQALMQAMGQQLKLYRSGLSLLSPASSSPRPAPQKTVDMALQYRVWGLQYHQRTDETLQSYGAICDLFQRDGVDGRLLIVGEAGMGKTHTLLAVGELLLQQAIQGNSPMPVLVDLSAWRGEPLNTWLMDYLWIEYRIARALATSWIEGAELCFLWDGFDHLPKAHQRRCANALETLLRGNVSQTALLCCHRKVLEESGITFGQFNSGILLVPMAAQQVKAYTLAINRPDLWQRIKGDRVLQQLARFPLCLSMLASMQSSAPIKGLQDLIQQFMAEKVKAPRPAPPQKSPASAALSSLSWLARHLEDHSRLFRLEALQQSWLPDPRKLLYRLLVGLCFALLFGVISGNLPLGLALGLMVSQVDLEAFPRYHLSFATASWSGLGALVLAATVPALVGGLGLGGLAALLLAPLELGLPAYAGGSVVGMGIGLLVGWGIVLWGGLQHSIQVRQTPNQDIRLGFRNTSLLFGWLGLLLALLWVVGSMMGGQPPLALLNVSRLRLLVAILISGVVWLSGGLQQSLVRLLLANQGSERWPLACLPQLQHWTQQQLLRQVGGGFCFSHELIRLAVAKSATNSNGKSQESSQL